MMKFHLGYLKTGAECSSMLFVPTFQNRKGDAV